jgi:hypothetical protein
MLVVATGISAAQQTCADFSNSTTLPGLTAVDTTEHTGSGLHSFSLTTVSKCTYAHGKTSTCDVTCNVDPLGATTIDPLGNFVIVETGALTVPGSHDVSGNWVSGVSQAFGSGTICTGQMAAGAANCGTLGAKCILSVTVTAAGASVSAASGSTVIWRSPTASVPVTCAPVADPQATPTPTPSPTPITSGGLPTDPCTNTAFVSGPTGDFSPGTGGGDVPDCSPIIIDISGNGFALTNAANGVRFDIAGTGAPVQIAWTAAGAGNAFLALPDSAGNVINGTQLFGNFTPQPSSTRPNGFAALAVYDQLDHGGNADGVIDDKDQIFSSLRLWIDANHDGVCQPEELHTLPEMGVFSIGLDYSLSMRTDEFGNVFHYHAKINQGMHEPFDVGRQAYDVFLVAK